MELIGSLYTLNSKEGMHLYYAVKERFGRNLDSRENFIIPESSNSFIEDVIKKTGIRYTIIKKNRINVIKENIDSMNLQKKKKHI